ncbi:MAG TPA: hypothetical protein VEK57_05240 [Thermoanaerobaculia bacterium]|nr:hypothetical protein [Thermoanaerobaculia bacterium]
MAITKSTNSGTEVVNPAAEPASLEPLTPTITHYQQLAANFSAALDEIAADLPKLEDEHVSTVNFVRSHLNVPLAFIATVIAVVEQTPALQGVGMLDVTEARDTLQLIEAFRPMLDKVTAFEKTVELTVNSRLASLGNGALQMYYLVKGLARDPKNAAARALASKLKRELNRPGRPSVTTTARKRNASAAEAPKEAVSS